MRYRKLFVDIFFLAIGSLPLLTADFLVYVEGSSLYPPSSLSLMKDLLEICTLPIALFFFFCLSSSFFGDFMTKYVMLATPTIRIIYLWA